MYAVYNTIVASSPTFDIKPELARSWAVSKDGLSITAQLQPNVKFHDGTDCDAAAVKWNLDFMLDPANNSPQVQADRRRSWPAATRRGRRPSCFT